MLGYDSELTVVAGLRRRVLALWSILLRLIRMNLQYCRQVRRASFCRSCCLSLRTGAHYNSGGKYDILVILELPDSKPNRRLGMFMVNLQLWSTHKLLLNVSRPVSYLARHKSRC
jgi:hypothetical protein